MKTGKLFLDRSLTKIKSLKISRMKNFYLSFLMIIALLMPRASEAQEQNVWEIIQSNPNTTLLAAVLAGSEIIPLLEGPGPVTVFAPSTTAIAALPPETIVALQTDTTGSTQALLAFHVVGDSIVSGDLADGLMIPTLQGGAITVAMTDAGLTLDGVPIVMADLIGTNGVVHVIEGILSPPPAPSAVSITFWVDASNIMVAEGGMILAGSFNEWTDLPMTDNGDGTWVVTVDLVPGTEVEYKFKNGPDIWEDGIEGDCVNGFGNRVITVPAEPTSTQLLSFNACERLPAMPAPAEMVSITFNVNTDSIEVADGGMIISGAFNEWSDMPMTDNGDGTWSATIVLEAGTELEYKFKNGPDIWEDGIVGDCVNGFGNRFLVVPAESQTLAPVFFNSCELAPPPTPAAMIDLTFVVDASEIVIEPEGMFLAGTFNGWTDGVMMDNGDGTWSATVPVVAGEVIEYKFKNGPAGWENGIIGSCTSQPDGNRMLTAPSEAATLPTVCFLSCFSCTQVGLTVTVDMSGEDIAPEGVFLAGVFNEWTDGPMMDNGDGTYTATVGVDPNSEVEYKFKNGPDVWEDGITGDCVNGFGNRLVVVAEEDVVVEKVCFNACAGCEKMVTFTVDMSEVEVAAEGVFLAGAFNEFSDMPMTDNGDGTWSATVTLSSGQAYEYKFKNGPDVWEEITGACTSGFSGNREVTVGNADITLPTVCFSSCVGCGLIGVSFNVDMSQERVDDAGVFVAGSFNEWTDTPLSDAGNGIWTGIIGVMPNDTIEFKYKNGPDGWEGTVEGECAADNGNRILIVDEMDATVMQTCFNSCDICMDEPDPDPIGATSLIIENSCLNEDGTLTIQFDLQFNCLVAPGNLAGMSEIGFHSGANNWSTVVEWDAEGAATAVNDGNDVFSVTIDPVAYYGLGSIDELENIMMVFNQGALFPDAPWESEGKAKDGAGVGGGLDGNCDDIILVFSELRNCSNIGGGGSLTSSSLQAGSCVGEDGTVTLAFDLSQNCGDAGNGLAGQDFAGFHSGANNWSSVVEWNGDGAVTAMNDGNDVFSLTIDPAAYYGIPLADLENIIFVLNQGPSFPDAPWDASGRDQGDGECIDLNATIAELPTCAAAPVAEVQDLPLTFESDNIEYMLFDFGDVVATRIDNPDPAGNGSGKVLSIEKPTGAQVWAGVALPIATPIDFSNSSLMYVRVWSPRADVPFLLKIEDTNSPGDANGNPSIFAEVFANTTVANAWETLVFDMSTHPDFNPANSYNQIVVFADMNNPGVGETHFVDNIAQEDLSTTSTLDLAVENQLKVAPNPFHNQTLVTWENPDNNTFQVTILSLTGQVMRNWNKVSGEQLIVTKDDLISGMYFINFRDEVGNTGTLKLMIE